MKLFFYAQHLSGVGHYVRTHELARVASHTYETWLLDAGRPVPRVDNGNIHFLQIPRMTRGSWGLKAIEQPIPTEQLFKMRRLKLEAFLETTKPDLIVFEHYPFSKWELSDEIDFVQMTAKKSYPSVKFLSSIRDIPLQTKHEKGDALTYEKTVLKKLNSKFDGLLVHSDPNLCALSDYFSQYEKIKIPTLHTGIVSSAQTSSPLEKLVVCNAGGGADAANLLNHIKQAWEEVLKHPEFQHHRLMIFSGLAQHNESTSIHPFSAEYSTWLSRAELAITCSGYNNVADMLSTEKPWILVPNPRMSDQPERAQLMNRLGVPILYHPINTKKLSTLIIEQLKGGKKRIKPNIDGAETTLNWIKKLVEPIK